MALAAIPLVALIAATASIVLLSPPVSITEVQERGDPALSPRFYAPLLNELAARRAAGPIEVVPTQRRGEAALWQRRFQSQGLVAIQPTPTERHLLRRTLNADTYGKWLDDNAISYVAISQGPYDWSAPDEVALVRHGLPYLQAVWWNQTWTLYAVRNPRPVISPPGQVIARDAVSLTVSLPEPGAYVVRVRWSRYLTASNGCMRPTEDSWSTIVVEHPGIAEIDGSFPPHHC